MIKSILQEGFVLKSRGFYKHAIETFYKALEVDNSSNELLLEIADCYYNIKDYERAINYIEQILNKNPIHIDSMKLLKQIFIDKQAWDETVQIAKNIYSITNESNDLAEIFYFLNKLGKFEEIFEYNLENLSHKIYYELAFAKYMLLDFVNAEIYINKALAEKELTKYILLKGEILYKQNKEDECIPLIEKLNYNSDNYKELCFIGLIKQYLGEYKISIEMFKKAIKLNKASDELYYYCASTYFKMGEISYAKKYYNLAISLKPDNQNYHFALANLYYSEKNYKRAFEELNYDFFEANLLKAIILYDTGYVALAKKQLENLFEEKPENPIVLEYLERVKEDLKI